MATQRLDRVEDELAAVRQLLASAASYAESANRGLNQLAIKVDDLTAAQTRTQHQLAQLTEKVDRVSGRVDEFVFQAQRLFTQQAERLNRTEGQADRLEAVVQLLTRNYEAQQTQLQEFQRSTLEFQRTTNAVLERIDRVLGYLLRNQS